MRKVIKIAIFFPKSYTRFAQRSSGGLFSRRRISQRATFKIVNTAFLNKQYCNETRLHDETLFDQIACVFFFSNG